MLASPRRGIVNRVSALTGLSKQAPSRYVRMQIRTQTSTREVCHSLIWHSGESESALKRFEPVAVAKLQRDGRGTLFALVAARRQKEFKRGIDTYAEHVCRRRRDGSQCFPLFVLFVLFGQAKRTLKEKNHKETFPLSRFWSCKSAIKKKYLSFFSSKKRHRHFKNKRRKA